MAEEDILETEAGDEPEADESAVAPSEPVAAQDGESEEPEAEAEETEEAKAAKRKGYQERANTRRLRERLEAAETERDRLKAERAIPQEQPPERDAFDDYEAFLEARAIYVAKQAAQSVHTEAQAKQARQLEEQASRQFESRWGEGLDKGREKYEDFDDVALTRENITDPMRDAIKDAPIGYEIAYYLGKHVAEADKIGLMTPLAQIRAIGAIEERLKERPTRPSAPKPMARGRTMQTAASAQLNDSMPMDQWLKVRNKQVGRS